MAKFCLYIEGEIHEAESAFPQLTVDHTWKLPKINIILQMSEVVQLS